MQGIDTDAFTRSASETYRALKAAGNITQRHAVVEGNGMIAVLIPARRGLNYAELNKRAKTYTHSCLKDVIGILGMDLVELFIWTLNQASVKKAIDDDLTTPGSKIQKALTKRSICIPLSPKHATALLVAQNATESQVQFMRNYGAGAPSLMNVRIEKRRYIANMPKLYIFRDGKNEWEVVQSQKMRDAIERSREIRCVKMNLKDTILAKLSECKSANLWPTPPISRVIPQEEVLKTVVVMLSIDSGAGTVKMMGRFLRDVGNQAVNEVFLIAQGVGNIESFDFFQTMLGDYRAEIDEIVATGITVDGSQVRIMILHVHDFKVMYILTGGKGPNSRYPCCHCATPKPLMCKSYPELMSYTATLPSRPEIKDLRGKGHSDFQKENTYNLLSIHSQKSQLGYGNLIIPILHIQLGIFNKIVVMLDAVVTEWETKEKWTSEDSSPGRVHLYMALAKFGVRRERYFAGEVAGESGRNLIRNMKEFSQFFFCASPYEGSSVITNFPEMSELQRYF